VKTLPKGHLNILFSTPKLENYICDPSSLPGEGHKDYVARMEKLEINYTLEWLEHSLAKKWGLELILPNPIENTPALEFSEESVRAVDVASEFEIDEDGYINWSDGREAEVLLSFDCSKSIDSLLKRANEIIKDIKKIIKPYKKTYKKQDKTYYIDYLRLLDAKQSGAEKKEIAKTIFPKLNNIPDDYNGNRHVDNGLKAAKRLLNHSYRFLASDK